MKPSPEQPESTDWLDNARIISIAAVVLLHTAAMAVYSQPPGSMGWWYGNIYDAAVRWCVPVFVMISGALLLNPHREENLTAFYRRRVSRVLIPLLFWSVFFVLWNAVSSVARGDNVSARGLIKSLILGSSHYHMWFLYMIVFLYAFTPFFSRVARYSSRGELGFLIAMMFCLAAFNAAAARLDLVKSNLLMNSFLSYVPYFFLGSWLRISRSAPSQPLLWSGVFLSVAATAAAIWWVTESWGLKRGLYFYEYLSVTVIPMSACVFLLMRDHARPMLGQPLTRQAAGLALGVYLVHPIFLEVLSNAGYGPITPPSPLTIPIMAAVVFCLSVLVVLFLKRVPYLRRIV
jgi:surface polysaccharide O-acyltransferase-like enzyme